MSFCLTQQQKQLIASEDFQSSTVDSVCSKVGKSVQNIPVEILTPQHSRPRCRYFCILWVILVSVVRRDVGTIPFLIDRFRMKWGVSRLFTLSYICRASSTLVLGVAGRTRGRMGAMQRQSG